MTSEGSLAQIKYGSRQNVQPKIRHLAPLDAAHARLQNEFTEGEKYHNLMTWLKYSFSVKAQGLKNMYTKYKDTNMNLVSFMVY